MARTTPQQWLQKWGQNLNASGAYITNGVKAVTVAPGVKASQSQAAYVAGVNKSAAKWANNVAGVSLQSWQNSMINKGIPRLAQGVTQAQANKTQAITTLLNNVDQATAAIANLPTGGLEQGIARATQFMRTMSQLSNGGNNS